MWRIKEEYIKDADGCEMCQAFWKKMEEDKEKHVNDILALIEKHK